MSLAFGFRVKGLGFSSLILSCLEIMPGDWEVLGPMDPYALNPKTPLYTAQLNSRFHLLFREFIPYPKP